MRSVKMSKLPLFDSSRILLWMFCYFGLLLDFDISGGSAFEFGFTQSFLILDLTLSLMLPQMPQCVDHSLGNQRPSHHHNVAD
ncbi:hypothetical protein JOB18_005567 [Solea senegalensis]|uniref:Uncharacterized protein n=1 Tax=Solea senegalensis TaxID=28829 RepID=A0AAV6RQ86_SOLSE|nr:hypothetical protein JOB18_005567 [Solea senegalensis]